MKVNKETIGSIRENITSIPDNFVLFSSKKMLGSYLSADWQFFEYFTSPFDNVI